MGQMPENPWVVMRAHNDAAVIGATLAMLHKQNYPFRLIVLDNMSADGTTDIARKYTDRIISIPRYIPGAVLNLGMRETDGEIVVFLNSDCTPLDEYWLENLLGAIHRETVAAVFSRQVPRPDCLPLYAKDTEETYGDGHRHRFWRNCFSMASCAIRRSVWDTIKFDETLCISEDIDWTWRAKQQGHGVVYVPESVVYHSHNFTLRQFYSRQLKEGRDEALIYDWTPWDASFLRHGLMPFGRQLLSDWAFTVPRLQLGSALFAPVLRTVQMVARTRGLADGLREKMARKEA